MAAKKKIKTKKTPAKKIAVKKAAPKKATAVKSHAKKAETPSALPVTPLDDRLIVFPKAMETITAGGLFIPASASDQPVQGTVLAKGRGRRNKKGQLRPLDVNVGDQVMFAEFSGTKITYDGKEFLILREEDVLGVVI